ncbi:MAG: phosphatidylserine decarboxylase family protein [Candidatus Rokuibacteriota bacterium]|nr:MAG: phosphatidylserine decarboxylase family protein [Candidatus Rokubacteria bacterium]
MDPAAADVTMKRLPVAREGWPFIAAPAALALGLFASGRRRLALPFVAATLASLGFFRDPERAVPATDGAVLSPADGRVTAVVDDADEWVGPAVRVSIFLSPLDVHVNRAPIAGRVADTRYTPGRFVAAFAPDAGVVNERCAVHLEGDQARVTVIQIAGAVARRIVCRVARGHKLEAGERFGMIRFGSRTDCLMPRSTDVRVRVGDRVRGGETVLGVLA